MKQRLQKVLSRAGIASRRSAETLILEGRVQVNGSVVTQLGTLADPVTQEVRVDGTQVRLRSEHCYILLNKPKGYVTTRRDPNHRLTVMDLLPPKYRYLFHVGRLDKDSTGLLLLTDDGELTYRLTHPKFKIQKIYLVKVLGRLDSQVLKRASKGIRVDSERLLIERGRILSTRQSSGVTNPNTLIRVWLRQGRNQEIRRLFKALGFPVIAIHRERVGSLSIKGLSQSTFRTLDPAEIKRLYTDVGSRHSHRVRTK